MDQNDELELRRIRARKFYKSFRESPPKTKRQLRLWVKKFLGFNVPDTKVCENHDTPMDFLWEIYNYKNEAKYDRWIAYANRGGYKTLLCAISEVLDLIFKDCGIVHIGAIEKQAKKCYSYVLGFLKHFEDKVQTTIQSKTLMKGGGTLEVIPCTMAKVNSPHEPKVRFDEIELAAKAPYEEAKGIPTADAKGNRASMGFISTRKYAFGHVARELESAPETGKKVYAWCYKEVCESCPDSKSGIEDIQVAIDREALTWKNKKEYDIMPDKSKDLYELYTVKDKCPECPLIPTCCGDLKRAGGNQPIDDYIMKFQESKTGATASNLFKETSGIDFWINQQECRKPSTRGLIYPQFTMYHIASQREMYEKAFGETMPDIKISDWIRDYEEDGLDYGVQGGRCLIPGCSDSALYRGYCDKHEAEHNYMIARFKNPNYIKQEKSETDEDWEYRLMQQAWECDWGKDWGWADPDVTEVAYKSPDDKVFWVDEYADTGRDINEIVLWLQTNFLELYDPQSCYCDPSSPGNINVMRNAEPPINAVGAARGRVKAKSGKDKTQIKTTGGWILQGISIIRTFLKVPGKGESRMWISPRCQLAIREFGLYHNKIDPTDDRVREEPDDKDNHAMDAIRYYMNEKFSHVGASGTMV